MKTKIAIAQCNSYEGRAVSAALEESIDLLGGITNFIKPGSRVLLKPNLLMAKEPEFGVCTHPEVVRAVIRILKKIECRIFLGDGPSVWGARPENVDEVYERTGMEKVCADEGVNLVKFEKKRWRKSFPLSAWLDHCDYLVNIPKFKTHEFTLLTGAIKNLFGLVSSEFKTQLHKDYFKIEDFSGILTDIYQETRPALTIVDGIVAMEGDGPGTGGKLRDLNLLLVGSDCVALDSLMARVMGCDPFSVLSTKIAAQRKLGVWSSEDIEIVGESLEKFLRRPFLLPAASQIHKIPQVVIKLAKKLFRYYPCIERDNCVSCAACILSCPKKAIRMKNKRIRFDYSRCISCFCCQEICPNAAIKIKRTLLSRLTGI